MTMSRADLFKKSSPRKGTEYHWHRFSGLGFMVQRSGLKKTRQIVSKGLHLYLVINPFHPIRYDGYSWFWLILVTVSIGC